MKVVIFCGGHGVRRGEAAQRIPKPMIPGRRQADMTATAWERAGAFDRAAR